MLEKLISEIRRGGTLQPAELAARLQVSLAMVQMMLEDLERMGKLARVSADCGATCGGCPVSDMCLPEGDGKGRVWMVKVNP
jgi:hypothetical protein